jgi:hypothetical protein
VGSRCPRLSNWSLDDPMIRASLAEKPFRRMLSAPLTSPRARTRLFQRGPHAQRLSFAARISTGSIVGAYASNSGAFAMRAAAIWPARCACRPASSGNASKIPNVVGPSFRANQTVVAGSALASGSALFKGRRLRLPCPALLQAVPAMRHEPCLLSFTSESSRRPLTCGQPF